MRDIWNLSRLMAEILPLCEAIHKDLERWLFFQNAQIPAKEKKKKKEAYKETGKYSPIQ